MPPVELGPASSVVTLTSASGKPSLCAWAFNMET